MEERKTIKMKNSVVNWHGYENYNMNCNIEDLKKRGFECSSYNNDLAPSYTNKKGNIQVFFIDLDSDEMKAEEMEYKSISLPERKKESPIVRVREEKRKIKSRTPSVFR